MHELSVPIDKQSDLSVSSAGGNTYVGPHRSTHVTTVAPDGPETPGTPAVRRAVRADLIEVHRIEQASFPQPWPFSALESYLDETGFLVAETGNDDDDPPAVAGYVIADTVPNHGTPLGHVKDIAVRPAYRREGVASALLARAIAVIGETGAGSIKLEVRAGNDGARQLYRRFGFEHRKTIPNYYSNGEDALVMVRLL